LILAIFKLNLAMVKKMILIIMKKWLLTCLCIGVNLSFSQGQLFSTIKNELQKELMVVKQPSEHLYNKAIEIIQQPFKSDKDLTKTYRYLDSLSTKYNDVFTLQLMIELCKNLQNNGKLNEAYHYLYKARRLYDKGIRPKDELTLFNYYKVNASSAYHYMHYKKALEYTRNQLTIAIESNIERINVYNMMGLVFTELEELDSSLFYYKKGVNFAKEVNEDYWVGFISGNIAKIYKKKEDFTNAIKYMQADIDMMRKKGSEKLLISALIYQAIFKLEAGYLEEAELLFEEANTICDKTSQIFLERNRELARFKLLEAKQDYLGALQALKSYHEIADSINKYRFIENQRRIEFQVDYEQTNSDLLITKEREKQAEFKFWIVLIGAILGFSLFGLLLRNIAEARKRERLILQLKQNKLDEDLKHKEREMDMILKNLMEKNQVIELLHAKLVNLMDENETNDEDKNEILQKLNSYTLLTEDDWLNFKQLFESLNPGFFERLKKRFSGLTNAETRLLTLIRLNLETTEIAKALAISPDSVRKTSLRLRKKIEVDDKDELAQIVFLL
jgi:DNA-binding CsgD family transcriptional regulator